MILKYHEFINELAHHYELSACNQLIKFINEPKYNIKKAIKEGRVFISFRENIYNSYINPFNNYETPYAYYSYQFNNLLEYNNINIDNITDEICDKFREDLSRIDAPFKPNDTKYINFFIIKNFNLIIKYDDVWNNKIK